MLGACRPGGTAWRPASAQSRDRPPLRSPATDPAWTPRTASLSASVGSSSSTAPRPARAAPANRWLANRRLRLDIEGSAPAAVAGAGRAFWREVRCLVLEHHLAHSAARGLRAEAIWGHLPLDGARLGHLRPTPLGRRRVRRPRQSPDGTYAVVVRR